MKIDKKEKPHYVNNADFSYAVVEYVKKVRAAKKENFVKPVVTDYIARCFLKIAEGLSHKANFVRYTYREEMVMDAVENCLKAVENYDIDKATRTGKPNAFAYFTQISWYAFLRRIAKEKKQQDVKIKFMTQSGVEEFIIENGDATSGQVMNAFVNQLKDRIDKVREKDTEFKEFATQEKKRKKIMSRKSNMTDSDLEDFM